MIEFKLEKRTPYAKSVHDHRWYKVQGITKTLDSMTRKQHYNMIAMDLFTRALQDQNRNPESSLEWIPEFLKSLNVPESKCHGLREALLPVFRSHALSPSACTHAWNIHRISIAIGTEVDSECKDVFNRRKDISNVGPVSRLILTQLQALCLTPICAGLKVAGVPTPDKVELYSLPFTYHNKCMDGCTSLRETQTFYTEVDLVAYDEVKGSVTLIELKTRHNDTLDKTTLLRYNTQLWLTWLMFSLTYPSVAELSTAYLVIVRPGTNRVTIRNCLRPTITKNMRRRFPFLNCFCPQVLNCLTPMCVNMRVETQLACGPSGALVNSRLDPKDLCYRNMLFNQEKLKYYQPGQIHVPEKINQTAMRNGQGNCDHSQSCPINMTRKNKMLFKKKKTKTIEKKTLIKKKKNS